MWECSECDFENDLDPDVEEGQIVSCTECGLEYEVLAIEPLDLQRVDGEDAGEPEEVEADADEEWDD